MKILFVHQGLKSYVKTDLDILRSSHKVRECYFPGMKGQGVHSIRYILSLFRGLMWCDLSFSWFGKIHAFFSVIFSRLLGKMSVVVVSGGEVCRFSFGGGRYRSLCTQPVKRWLPRYTAQRANLLLPVSKYVYNEGIESVGANLQRMKMIYHGFDTARFRRLPGIEKQAIAITVAEVMDENLYHKCLSDFITAAEFAPEVSFVLIGPDHDGTAGNLKAKLPKNAVITGGLYGHDLVEQMSQATVYVQASAWESFGCAVAEAMACECVPVVTRIPALKEVVGDCGVYLNDPVTPQEIAAKVQIAFQQREIGKRARQRIVQKFPLEKRCEALLDTIGSLMFAGAVSQRRAKDRV